jgi:hypothetical protein
LRIGKPMHGQQSLFRLGQIAIEHELSSIAEGGAAQEGQRTRPGMVPSAANFAKTPIMVVADESM